LRSSLLAHRHIPGMPTGWFYRRRTAALSAFLREAIAADATRWRRRWRPIKSALAKIDPQPEPPRLPPLKPPGVPSTGDNRSRGRADSQKIAAAKPAREADDFVGHCFRAPFGP